VPVEGGGALLLPLELLRSYREKYAMSYNGHRTGGGSREAQLQGEPRTQVTSMYQGGCDHASHRCSVGGSRPHRPVLPTRDNLLMIPPKSPTAPPLARLAGGNSNSSSPAPPSDDGASPIPPDVPSTSTDVKERSTLGLGEREGDDLGERGGATDSPQPAQFQSKPVAGPGQ
jgi:hypothetical protein